MVQLAAVHTPFVHVGAVLGHCAFVAQLETEHIPVVALQNGVAAPEPLTADTHAVVAVAAVHGTWHTPPTHCCVVDTHWLLELHAAAHTPPTQYGVSGVVAQFADVRHPGVVTFAAHTPPCGSHGTRARARFGATGACGEAARGFPSLFRAGVPALEDALGRGCDFTRAMTQAFFAVLAALDDTNLLHRGGREGLIFARECARRFLSAGGVFAPVWRVRAADIHARFVGRGLNPGGAGDMLACAAFVHFIAGRTAWASR